MGQQYRGRQRKTLQNEKGMTVRRERGRTKLNERDMKRQYRDGVTLKERKRGDSK